jgi:hypothetical protein
MSAVAYTMSVHVELGGVYVGFVVAPEITFLVFLQANFFREKREGGGGGGGMKHCSASGN